MRKLPFSLIATPSNFEGSACLERVVAEELLKEVESILQVNVVNGGLWPDFELPSTPSITELCCTAPTHLCEAPAVWVRLC